MGSNSSPRGDEYGNWNVQYNSAPATPSRVQSAEPCNKRRIRHKIISTYKPTGAQTERQLNIVIPSPAGHAKSEEKTKKLTRSAETNKNDKKVGFLGSQLLIINNYKQFAHFRQKSESQWLPREKLSTRNSLRRTISTSPRNQSAGVIMYNPGFSL